MYSTLEALGVCIVHIEGGVLGGLYVCPSVYCLMTLEAVVILDLSLISHL